MLALFAVTVFSLSCLIPLWFPHSNLQLLYSTHSGVVCPSKSGAVGNVLLLRTAQGPEDSPRTRYRPPSGGL